MANDVLVSSGVQGVRVEVEKLTKSVGRFAESSDKYSKRLLGLTWAIASLTFVMTILTAVMAVPLIREWITGPSR